MVLKLYLWVYLKKGALGLVSMCCQQLSKTHRAGPRRWLREAEKSDKKISIDKAAVKVAYIILMNSNVVWNVEKKMSGGNASQVSVVMAPDDPQEKEKLLQIQPNIAQIHLRTLPSTCHR